MENLVVFDIEVKNKSERIAELELELVNIDEENGYFWCDDLIFTLEKLEFNKSEVITVKLVPFKRGLLVRNQLNLNLILIFIYFFFKGHFRN